MTLHSQRFATETLIRLSEKIPNIEIILEYSIKPYRVDAYLPDHNISIEIDENDHAVYDPEKEFERSRYITNTLHCSWIRVNNSDSIENTVEQLLKQLKYYGISPTTIVPQELIKESQLPSGNTLQNKSYVQQLREFKAQQAEEAAKLELERLQQKRQHQDKDEIECKFSLIDPAKLKDTHSKTLLDCKHEGVCGYDMDRHMAYSDIQTQWSTMCKYIKTTWPKLANACKCAIPCESNIYSPTCRQAASRFKNYILNNDLRTKLLEIIKDDDNIKSQENIFDPSNYDVLVSAYR